MTLKPLELRVLTSEEREARELAFSKAKRQPEKIVKVRPLKRKKK